MIYNNLNLEVAKFASKSDIRPEIACVFFKKNATIGTDGFKLVEVSTPLDTKNEDYSIAGKTAMAGCEPFLLPASEIKSIKLKDKKGAVSVVAVSHLDSEKAELLVKNAGQEGIKIVRRVNGQYPDYANLFPQGDPIMELTLNASYLAEICELMAKMGKSETMTIKLFGDSRKLVVIEASNDKQFARALLMPVVNK